MSTPYKFSLPSTFPSHYFLRQPIFHFVVQGSQVSHLIETYCYSISLSRKGGSHK